MNQLLYQHIKSCTGHRPSRDCGANFIFENADLIPDLVAVALDTSDENHHKACWILELVLDNNIENLAPFLNDFCKTLPYYLHDGAIRSVSKIVMFAAKHHSKTTKSALPFLSDQQLKKMTEACFDWLIGNRKVASKAYSMRALFEFGKRDKSIYAELKGIIEADYTKHSAAYKAVTKELLRKMK